MAASEEMRDGNKNDGAQSGRRQRIPKTSTKNSEFHEDAPANEGANDPENDVRDASKAAATRDFPCEPTSYQADEYPIEKAVRKNCTDII